MKRRWLLPVVLSSIIVVLLIATAYAFLSRRQETLFVDEYMKRYHLTVKGTIGQTRTPYFQRGNQSRPAILHVRQGDKVTKGQALFSYEDRSIAANEKELSLKIDNQLIAINQIEGQLAVKQEAFEQSASPRINAELNWLISEYEKHKNELEILKTKESAASEAVDQLTITSETTGIVSEINKEQLQQFTNAKQQFPIVTIAAAETFVTGEVDQKLYKQLEKGMQFDFEIDGKSYKSKLTSLTRTIEHSTAKYYYKAAVDIDEAYVGEVLTFKIYPNVKDHIWLHKDYVNRKKHTYYVQKCYGNRVNEEIIHVKKQSGQYYLVTKGLSSVDELKKY
ncbi:HlyD family efflux transporter periplasmic adaptor subunit [Macrococcus psychrotolerans]|uniref:HlyD family efflux transporter periplasmic adaptor subunit n=1 Tax=Macrococcus psychrotolerans TaxID=3039389 RepID=A0AAT9P5Z1_9STAP|nr:MULTISPECIES: HlyD family efflux transporter periplasmic adaptor subunit [Macrococcus]QYA33176.1 efflux RND transporter periplasmic adaptor subunit [Macrococcus sp. 19Msa1099]QYA37990.1 efflux RND transporter periplasmic adaptor subunit [Macrococcus caseolyticus]QYA76697.1 efflux RND transporter periplasmic adaptor subunit [Macrococcus caseolyticus]